MASTCFNLVPAHRHHGVTLSLISNGICNITWIPVNRILAGRSGWTGSSLVRPSSSLISSLSQSYLLLVSYWNSNLFPYSLRFNLDPHAFMWFSTWSSIGILVVLYHLRIFHVSTSHTLCGPWIFPDAPNVIYTCVSGCISFVMTRSL